MKPIKAYADIGSHGGIFMFEIGAVASLYPSLLHIFHKRVTDDLQEVLIIDPKTHRAVRRAKGK